VAALINMRMTQKVHRLVEANRASPLVYQSASSDDDEIAFRLRDGSVHRLTADDARALHASGHVLRWAHLEGVEA
jgi:hypothetical protein